MNMHITIIKESGSNQLSNAAHIVNGQKIIVSSALNQFTPFQFVLVPVSSQSLALCQVIKKPDLHQNFCYLNTSVSCQRKDKSSQVNESLTEQIGGDLKNVLSKKVKNSDGNNEFMNRDFSDNHPGGDVFLTNPDGKSDLTSQIDKTDLIVKSEFTDDLSNVSRPNVFEEFIGNKLDLESIVELTDDVKHCKKLNVTVVVNEFYRGTSEEFGRLVQQILNMYTFTSHCFINVNLEKIHSIIIHDATPSPPSKPTQNPTPALSKSNSSNFQTQSAQGMATPSSGNLKRRQSKTKTISKETVDENKTPKATSENLCLSSNSNTSPCAFNNPSRSFLNNSSLSFQSEHTNSSLPQTTPQTENTTSNISTTGKSDPNSHQTNSEISQSITSTIEPNETNLSQTKSFLEKDSVLDSKKETSEIFCQCDSENSNSIWSTDSNDTNKKDTSQKSRQFKREPTQMKTYPSISSTQLLFVSPKSKLTVQNTYSVDYYKQLIRFRTECVCVEEYVQCSEAWKRMKELIECKKRGAEVTTDGKQLNSANKILLSGPSGSGKTFLVRTLARALGLPLLSVTSSELSASSPGVAESNLRAKFFQAGVLAKENEGPCILLFEQIHDLIPAIPPSLSHITRLSLSLTSLLDATPPSSPLLFIFTSTSAHSIGARLKAHAQIYLTAPTSDMRTAILRSELAPISILSESARERSMTRDSIRTRVGSIRNSSDEKSFDDSIPDELPMDEVVKSVGEKSIELSIEGDSDSVDFDSMGRKSISEESIRDKLVTEVRAVTGSFLPVDLVRLAGAVTMFVARNRGFTTESLIAHVRTFLSHYRPSCLRAGGLGVVDLPSGGPGVIDLPSGQRPPIQTRPELELAGEHRELLEGGGREDIGGHEPQEDSETSACRVGPRAAEWVPELGGLSGVRALIEKKVEWPFKYAAAFERLGIPRSKGILLYGPPGCAKTSLVRALASGFPTCRLLAASAAQLYSPYVGEAEANVAQLFTRARSAAPAILFIDEIDALVGNRSDDSKDVQQSVLSVFLNEMDGVGVKPEIGSAGGGGVMVIAATNRPSSLDSALLRPGRLDSLIYVRPPDLAARREILASVSRRGRMAPDVDLECLAGRTELYSGADLASLYTEAALISLLDKGFDNTEVSQTHWLQALSVTRPSLSLEQLEYYEAFENTV